MSFLKADTEKVVEIRRFCFRSNIDLRELLKGIYVEAGMGGEYTIRETEYKKVLRILKDSPELEVTSLQDQIQALGSIHYRRAQGRLWGLRVESPENWTYLSMIARRWKRCNLTDRGYLLVRPGWLIARHRQGGKPTYFYFPNDIDWTSGFQLEDYQLQGDKGIRLAYQGVLGRQPVPFWETTGLIMALWPGYVIPKEHERLLSQTISPVINPIVSEEGENIWVWKASDKKILEGILRELGLELAPWEAGRDWVYSSSLIMKRAYGTYLRSHDGVDELLRIIRRRAWHLIEDESLKEIIRQLCLAESSGDKPAHVFLNYMESKICKELDYKDYKLRVDGWVIESSPVFYQNHVLDKRYYRVVLPEYEIPVGWQSKQHADWETTARPKVGIYHWRIVPYIGRMKTMSNAKAPELFQAGRNLRDMALRSLIGIPSTEWKLANDLNIGSFMLDLDGAHWKGCQDLSRYFVGYGQVIRKNPEDCEGYGLLLKDVFGETFALESSVLRAKDVPEINEWVNFVARSSLLLHQSRRRIQLSIPVFDLVSSGFFRRAYQTEVLRQSILGWVKYHWGVTESALTNKFSSHWEKQSITLELKGLIANSDIVLVNQQLYFRYSSVSAHDMSQVIRGQGQGKYEIWNILRELLHPMYVRSAKLMEESDYAPKRRMWMVHVIAKRGIEDLLAETKRKLDESGVAGVSAVGRQIDKAHSLIDILVEDKNVFLSRSDGLHQFENGDQEPKVEYFVRNPAKQLKAHFEAKG